VRLPAHRDQCDVTDCLSIKFIPKCSVFTPQMALPVGNDFTRKTHECNLALCSEIEVKCSIQFLYVSFLCFSSDFSFFVHKVTRN
jgi:hypothetical protein